MERLTTEAETLSIHLASLKAIGSGDLQLFGKVNQNAALRELLRRQQLSLWIANAKLTSQLVRPD